MKDHYTWSELQGTGDKVDLKTYVSVLCIDIILFGKKKSICTLNKIDFKILLNICSVKKTYAYMKADDDRDYILL